MMNMASIVSISKAAVLRTFHRYCVDAIASAICNANSKAFERYTDAVVIYCCEVYGPVVQCLERKQKVESTVSSTFEAALPSRNM